MKGTMTRFWNLVSILNILEVITLTLSVRMEKCFLYKGWGILEIPSLIILFLLIKKRTNPHSLSPRLEGLRLIVSHWVFWPWRGYFFWFLPKWGPFKKITNLGKSCLIGTTSYAEIVSIRHDFCHVILKSCQLCTTSACHTEVVPTWHDFCHVIIFNFIFNFIVYILGSKLCNVKN